MSKTKEKIRPTFTVDEGLYRQAREVSNITHISLSGIVGDALRDFVAKHRPIIKRSTNAERSAEPRRDA